MSEDAAPHRPGEMIGPYKVETIVGTGAMSTVVVARDERRYERVAIRILLPQKVANAETRARFLREARAASRVVTEHVTRIKEVAALDDGTPYLVMERLEGETLSALLARTRTLSVGDAVRWILETCEALARAHKLGVVHGELEPANLFLARKNGMRTLKVLNLGISRSPPGAPPRTSRYMAPEQTRSVGSVDARSDVWAIGVILYELVAGESPFAAGTPEETAQKILHDTPALRGAPLGLQAVIRRCLAKAPQDRYASAADLVHAIEAADLTPSIDPATAIVPASPTDDEIYADGDGAIVGGDDDDEEPGSGPWSSVDEHELLPEPPTPPPAPLPESLRMLVKSTPMLEMALPRSEPSVPAQPTAGRKPVTEAHSPPPSSPRQAATQTPTPPPEAFDVVDPPPRASRLRWLPLALAGVLVPALALAVIRIARRGRPAVVVTAAPPPSSAAPTTSAAPDPEQPRIVDSPVVVPPPPASNKLPVASTATKKPAPARDPQPVAAGSDDSAAAFKLAARNNAALKQTCWEPSDRMALVVTVDATVSATGVVTGAIGSSSDARLASCCANQVLGWTFPSAPAARTVPIKIRFRR